MYTCITSHIKIQYRKSNRDMTLNILIENFRARPDFPYDDPSQHLLRKIQQL